MLAVSTYLDRSRRHGTGLFAGQDIAAGTTIWSFDPGVDMVYGEEAWQALRRRLAPCSFDALQRYAYKTDGRYTVCLDNAQFMNHSDEPNVGNRAESDTMFALRSIARGEELLCDYREYCDPDDANLLAVLGHPACCPTA